MVRWCLDNFYIRHHDNIQKGRGFMSNVIRVYKIYIYYGQKWPSFGKYLLYIFLDRFY